MSSFGFDLQQDFISDILNDTFADLQTGEADKFSMTFIFRSENKEALEQTSLSTEKIKNSSFADYLGKYYSNRKKLLKKCSGGKGE